MEMNGMNGMDGIELNQHQSQLSKQCRKMF